MKKIMLLLIVFAGLIVGCSNSENLDNTGVPEGVIDNSLKDWLIPQDEVKDGGPGKDGIPSIDNPQFLELTDSRANYIKDDDLVIGVAMNGQVRAYPHLILDWHEIVNDMLVDSPVTISYCPLTGTGFGWSSEANMGKSTFGVSGLLYNANLILYDRKTDSNWSQLRLECVNGSQKGDKPTLINVVETTWRTWRTLYPETTLLSLDTGESRDYGTYPYGSYKTNNEYFIFQALPLNEALPNKQRVHAIIVEGKSKVYQFENFGEGKATKDVFKGKDYVIVGNKNIVVSFELSEEELALNFKFDLSESESLFTDNEGNKWTPFGEAIEGPRKGTRLKATTSVASYWFAIGAFYPDPEIYQP